VDSQPRLLNLKQVLEAFVRHRREVVTRRTVYELRKARERAHILEGLAVALANIDEVIALIKASKSRTEARAELVRREWQPGIVTELLQRSGSEASRPDGLEAQFGYHGDVYHLSETQAQAILDLRLHQLTGLEQGKIVDEYKEVIERIDELLEILNNPDRLMQVIRDELREVREQFGDERRTEIMVDHLDLTMEDLVTEEDMVVTLSHSGYAKSQPLSDYQAQRRGGRGKSATKVKEEDFIDKLFIASSHDTILCFSSRGKAYWLKVYQLPQAGRMARGKPIVNLLPLEEGERINAVLPIREYTDDQFIFMATAQGTVKKTPLSDFSHPRSNGIIAVDLRADDYLVNVDITDGSRDVMLFSSTGKAIRFKEADVRPMGRTACGVRGIRLTGGQRVIALIIVDEGGVLMATENGYGKRTLVSDYPTHGRGGQGVISIQGSGRNGDVVGAVLVQDEDEIMLISNAGTLVRTRVNEISTMGRNTQGVRLINLHGDEKLVGVERVVEVQDEEDPDKGTE
jgi:DNA gyrase subunit A